MSKIISVIQEKGGAGKSTLLCGLAGILSDEGYKVAIIDTDPQRTAAKWCEKENTKVDHTTELEDSKLAPTIRSLKNSYDIIFIDTAGYKSSIATFAMGHSDLVLIPSKASAPDAQGAINTHRYLEAVIDNMGKAISSFVVLTDLDKGTKITEGTYEALSEVEGLVVLDGVCWHRTGLKEMISNGSSPQGSAREAVQNVLSALKAKIAFRPIEI